MAYITFNNVRYASPIGVGMITGAMATALYRPTVTAMIGTAPLLLPGACLCLASLDACMKAFGWGDYGPNRWMGISGTMEPRSMFAMAGIGSGLCASAHYIEHRFPVVMSRAGVGWISAFGLLLIMGDMTRRFGTPEGDTKRLGFFTAFTTADGTDRFRVGAT